MCSVSSVSFKSFVPMKYYAKHPKTGEYVPVLKRENIRKCQNKLVTSLNNPNKKGANKEIVNLIKSTDKDYRNYPKVKSVYDIDKATVYLITGADVDKFDEKAKPIGIEKGRALEATGSTKSFEAKAARDSYFDFAKSFFSRTAKQFKNNHGENLTLNVFFEPNYNTKNTLKGFTYRGARFETTSN